MSKKNKPKKLNNLIANGSVIAQNRRAKFDYDIKETFETGIVLTGSEVKSIREGKMSINEAYVTVSDGELQLINASIEEYSNAGYSHHAPRRVRRLLMKKKEIMKLTSAIEKKGMTIVPIRVYFKESGFIKVLVGLAQGKTRVDKRDTIKDRDWQRDKARILKNYNN